MLIDPVARTRILGWESDVRYVVARLRANYATRSADPQLRVTVNGLMEVSPEFLYVRSAAHVPLVGSLELWDLSCVTRDRCPPGGSSSSTPGVVEPIGP
jgi:MmyB-like transcription regulator ligand binding domain